MRKIILLLVLSAISFAGFSQDLSNKGKDFWVGYGYHQVMGANGGSQDMLLYFATDQVTNITVTIPGIGWTRTYTSGAGNNIVTSDFIPKNTPQDACLRYESTAPESKGIHITSDRPMVAYAHIQNGSVSGATVLYPTPTLGKEYYSVNYTNISNTTNANCWFYVVATDPGTTQVEITPSAPTINHPAKIPFTVTLQQGEIYNVMGQFNNGSLQGEDLTGSLIKSLSTATEPCKRIAVFSGSGRISIACGASASSSDNYMVQALPKTTWGKNYLTVPTYSFNSTGFAYNVYRVCVADPLTQVYIDGVLTTLPLQNGFYYEIATSQATHKITADQPILVAQYLPSRDRCGNTSNGDGDPEVIYLSSVEQSISQVTWNACRRAAINVNKHYINVIIPNSGTAISSFKLDGVTVPASNFTVHPRDAAYSYALLNVAGTNNAALSGIQHSIQSDSGFNAIAYGYGSAESYGYNAGTNVKDLTRQLELGTQFGIESSPSICTNAPFNFKVYFPVPNTPTSNFDSLKWSCASTALVPGNLPITVSGLLGPPIDSSNIRNGKPVNWYSLPGLYSFNAAGTYTVTITTYKSTSEGCGNSQDYDFDVTVYDPPPPSFAVVVPGCYLEPTQFIETTPQTPKATYKWYWDFGDGNTTTSKNPTHTYAAPGTYTVRFADITTPGCVSDTITQTITIPDVPTATIAGTSAVCVNAAAAPIVFNGTEGQAPYEFTYDINGGAPQTIISAGSTASLPVVTTVPGTFVYHLLSVKNLGSTLCTKIITGQLATVTINDNAIITLSSAPATANQSVCINNPIVNIIYAVTGSGTGASIDPGFPLPAGVTGAFSAGVFTITGTPTVAGTFTYKILTAGPCGIPSISGTITVTGDATIALTSALASDDQTVCVNTPIANITYGVAGSATGATINFIPALPGVTGTYSAGVFTIAGIPNPVITVPTIYNYTISTTGPCVTPQVTGKITLTPDATISLTSAPATTNQSVCINNPIANITYAIGGSGTNGNVTFVPALAGVTGTYAAGVLTISGTPSVSGTFNYTAKPIGPCATPQLSGTIIVNADATIALASAPATTNQTVCVNNGIIPITYNVGGGGTGASLTLAPALPGVTIGYSGGVATISGIPNPVIAVPTVYNYTIATNGPCIKPQLTGTITVSPDATISLTSAPATANQAVCINTPITNITYAVGGSGTGGTVTFITPLPGVTGVYAAGVVTISGTPTVSGTFPYTVKSVGPCANPQLSGTITVNPDHTLTLNAASNPNQTVCLNTPINPIVYTIGGGATGVTITGLPAGLISATVGNTVTISGAPSATGTYTVTTTGNSCVFAQLGGTITVLPLPTANFSYTAPACNTRTITYTDNSIPNAGTLTGWSWDFGDATTGTGTPITHVYATAGTFQVKLTVNTSNNCSNAAPFIIPVTISPRPQANFTVPLACINDNVLFPDASTGTNLDPLGYKWNFGDPASGAANTSTTKDGTHIFSATGLHTVQHIVTTVAGCTDTITHDIFISSSPVADFTVNAAAPLCVNDTVGIINKATIAAGTISKIEVYWDNAGAPGVFDVYATPALNALYKHKYPNFQTPLTKTYTIRYRVFSVGSCVDEKFTTITLNAVPKVQFTAMPAVCYDATPFQITQASEIGGVPGTGSYSGPGVSVTGIFNPVAAGIGTHTIKYTFSSAAANCTDTISNTITVLDTASARFTYTRPLCDGTVATFKDVSISPSGVTLNNTTWDFGDGSPTEVHAAGSTFTHSYPAWGSYTVTMFNTSATGCKSTSIVQAVRVNPNPNPAFVFNETSVCLPNASVSFLNNSSIADASEIGFTYLWNFGDIASGVLNTSLAKTPAPHVYSGAGPYTVTLTVTSDSGCAKSVSKPVNFIHPQPIAAFDMSKPGVCIGDAVTFNDITNGLDGTVNQWFWDFGDGSTGGTKQITHQFTDTLVYNVSLYTVNSFGCKSTTLTQPFTVYPYPVFDAGPDLIVLEGGSITLKPNYIRGTGSQYLWTPSTYLNDNTLAYPTASNMLDDITYTLQVTGRGGCVAPTDKMFVKVLKSPKVPNTFTPNGDGINETWKIEYLDTYPNCKVQVFTRTGQLVFESRGYKTPWDGTIKGKPLPFDTYYYVIEPENGRKPMTGYVTIVK